jgi:cytochrome c oxidase subunit IV
MAHTSRKEYLIIFFWLLGLTILEVALVYVPGISTGLLVLGLVMLAIVKATLVALFFMHLKHETKVLKATVAIPMALPAVYALVLVSEAAWRYLRW